MCVCVALSGTTASSVLNWVLLHLALNPEVQQTLYEEAVGAGEVTAERIATKAVYPYLHAVIREQHRLTPALPMSVFKKNSRSEIDIHGVTFPQNTMFALDSMSLQRLPEYAPDPETFDPTRWLPDAVKARKVNTDPNPSTSTNPDPNPDPSTSTSTNPNPDPTRARQRK